MKKSINLLDKSVKWAEFMWLLSFPDFKIDCLCEEFPSIYWLNFTNKGKLLTATALKGLIQNVNRSLYTRDNWIFCINNLKTCRITSGYFFKTRKHMSNYVTFSLFEQDSKECVILLLALQMFGLKTTISH